MGRVRNSKRDKTRPVGRLEDRTAAPATQPSPKEDYAVTCHPSLVPSRVQSHTDVRFTEVSKARFGEGSVVLIFVQLFSGCLTSLQHASVSLGRISPSHSILTSVRRRTEPTSPSADPVTPGVWQGSHWITNFQVHCMTRPRKSFENKSKRHTRILA